MRTSGTCGGERKRLRRYSNFHAANAFVSEASRSVGLLPKLGIANRTALAVLAHTKILDAA
jgi:hypothetical protein